MTGKYFKYTRLINYIQLITNLFWSVMRSFSHHCQLAPLSESSPLLSVVPDVSVFDDNHNLDYSDLLIPTDGLK